MSTAGDLAAEVNKMRVVWERESGLMEQALSPSLAAATDVARLADAPLFDPLPGSSLQSQVYTTTSFTPTLAATGLFLVAWAV